MQNVFSTKTFDEWRTVFSTLDACVEPVLTFSESCKHEQIIARDMIVEVKSLDGSLTQKQIASPFKFSNAHPRYDHIGTKEGAHTREVMHEILGMNDSEIEIARKSGAFG